MNNLLAVPNESNNPGGSRKNLFKTFSDWDDN